MTLGSLIKEYRSKNNLSMDDFANKSGISKAYISLLEKNKHPKTGKPISPSIHCIKQAADAMDIDFNILLSKIDADKSPQSDIAMPANLLDPELRYTLSDNRLGTILTNYCQRENISANAFAEKLGISKETYAYLLIGKFFPSLQLIKKISAITKYDIDYLTGAINQVSVPADNVIKIGEMEFPFSYSDSDFTFQSRFEDLCAKNNVNSENCEEKISFSHSQFIDVQYNRMPTLSELLKLSYAFDVSIDYLLGQISELDNKALYRLRKLKDDNDKDIIIGEINKMIKLQRHESVAADRMPLKKTGTEDPKK